MCLFVLIHLLLECVDLHIFNLHNTTEKEWEEEKRRIDDDDALIIMMLKTYMNIVVNAAMPYRTPRRHTT